MKSLHLILIAIVCVVAIYLLTGGCRGRSENYTPDGANTYNFLGAFDIAQGGSRAEMNEECLQYPGNQFCMLTDGTSGVCVLSGHCVADMMVDHRQELDEIKRPLCTQPVFKEGCGRFVKCKELKGDYLPKDHDKNLAECLSWYFPTPTAFPM